LLAGGCSESLNLISDQWMAACGLLVISDQLSVISGGVACGLFSDQ